MPLLSLQDIWKAYGANPVLEGITWKIEPGDRIGLVGHNGCGKTTLFHILTGEGLPDQGQVHRQRDLNIGFLAQEPLFDPTLTVIDVALEAFADLLAMQHQLHEMEQAMANGKSDSDFLQAYGQLRDRYEHLGGYALEARTKAILFGLGFRESDLNLPTQVLSGGQKNRLALAQLLAREPDLLLLDEPTNHLDLQALEWLEYFLSDYRHAYVIISHDRYFLDRATRTIVELEFKRLAYYPGNYSFYTKEKALRRSQQQKAFEAQQAHIARTEDYIRRNIAGQKTKQAQSRRRALEKVERLERPTDRRDMRLKLAATSRGGDRVLQIEALAKAYDQRPLFDNLNLTLWRGDRLGIVGPNGSGKSTLLKIIIDELEADAGAVIPGKGLEIGYFDQTRQDLNPNLSVLDEVWSLTPGAPVEEIRSFLGAFLFSGDDVERKISALSGGEQSRIALAKLMRAPLNLLLLDEPTNHLDIASRNVLENALETFNGTLITVSHDRYFLNRLVNRLLVFGDGQWRLVEGNYDTWQQQAQREADEQAASVPQSQPQSNTAYQTRKRSARERQRQERRASDLEQRIANLEEKIDGLETEMAREDLATDWNRLEELAREKANCQRKIDDLFAEWETLEAALAD